MTKPGGADLVEGARLLASQARTPFPEIQALRAIAVMGVVIYHLWPGIVPGGYAGVDVFFVISGFLITAHLLRELQKSGRLELSAFYARRIRRLLPAALLVLIVTGVATVLLLPLRDWLQVLREIGASVLYVENWALAADSVDYLAQNANIASPVQHYWSLSVEEQFYIVWPLLLTLGWWLSRRSSARSRIAVLAGVLGIVFLASLSASILLTVREPGPAYFGTHTRAWEFAAGGILALVYNRAEGSSKLRIAVSWLGLVAIAFTFLRFNGATPFPGYTALVPVLGTAAVIWAGNPTGRFSPRRLLQLPPAQYLGGISYSLYLWHWPLVVFVPIALARDPEASGRAALLIVAVILAIATKRYVEDPIRTAPFLVARRPQFTLAVTALAMTLIVVLSVGASANAGQRLDAERMRVVAALESNGGCLGAGVLISPECVDVALGEELVPGADGARADDVNTPRCWSRNGEDSVKVCTEGPKDPALRVALVGDSHSNQYLSALKFLAEENDWQFDVYGKTGCIWNSAVQVESEAWVENCESWKSKLNVVLAEADPYDVILTSYSATAKFTTTDGRSVEESIVGGFVDAWAPLAETGSQIVAIRDNPRSRPDYLECIDQYGRDVAKACSMAQTEAFNFFDGQPAAVDRVPGAHLLDLTEYFCQEESCSPVIGNVIVYRDVNHLTSTYARSLAPEIRTRVLELTGLVER